VHSTQEPSSDPLCCTCKSGYAEQERESQRDCERQICRRKRSVLTNYLRAVFASAHPSSSLSLACPPSCSPLSPRPLHCALLLPSHSPGPSEEGERRRRGRTRMRTSQQDTHTLHTSPPFTVAHCPPAAAPSPPLHRLRQRNRARQNSKKDSFLHEERRIWNATAMKRKYYKGIICSTPQNGVILSAECTKSIFVCPLHLSAFVRRLCGGCPFPLLFPFRPRAIDGYFRYKPAKQASTYRRC